MIGSLSAEARSHLLRGLVQAFVRVPGRKARTAVREVARILIHDENESNRIDAVEVLQLAGTRADLLALVACTYDHAWAVRASAYGALVVVGRKRALSHLRRGTFDPDPIVRRYVPTRRGARAAGHGPPREGLLDSETPRLLTPRPSRSQSR
ncbi:MAG: HEAT repeat domain-containing protein [Fimbriimonas sp.]